jgi:tetratricopeptide (TPR) repeat protein
MAGLLPFYEAGALDEETRDAFEAHVLACDLCFQELERGAAMSATLDTHRARFADGLALDGELAPSKTQAARRSQGRMFDWARTPGAGLAYAAILVALIVGTLHVRDSARDPRRLASFSLDAFASEAVRSPGDDGAIQQLVDAGLSHLELGHHDEAARRFRAALDRDPADARAEYLLGLTHALSGRIDAATADLERAASRAAPALRPAVLWTLANAYLASGRLEEARASLTEVAALAESVDGPYGEKARALLGKLGPAP